MKDKLKQQRAITLIALIISIIILVILAAVSIKAVLNNGIIGRAVNGAQDYARASKDEESIFKKIEDLLNGNSGSGNSSGSTGDDSAGAQVEFAEALAAGEYKYTTDTANSVKYYTPDLTGFNGKQTYYVVYDASGNESIPGRCDLMNPSEVTGWYDYENQKWANVVTVNDNAITYWTWIPRYMYYANGSTEEIYFVDLDNNCTLKKDGTETTYTSSGDTLTVDEKTYTISDAFKFDNKKLKGYWISKYEVQFEATNDNYRILAEEDGTDVKLSTITAGNSYYLYLNGVKQEGTITLPTTIHNVDTSKGYQIMLVDTTTGKIRTKTVGEKVRIDLSGFNPERTFYVEYDQTAGEEIIEKKQVQIDSEGRPTNAPDKWYDYNNKKWANIVTVNDSSITYWTYIPRYQYRIINGVNYEDINFIAKSKTTPDEGFTIPDSFSFDGKPLHGYWISKYEVQYESNVNRVTTEVNGNKIKINTAQAATGPFLLYINGVKQSEEIATLPAEISADTTKDNFIMLISKTNGKILTTLVKGEIQIDLSGFEPSCTYYVEYDLTTGEEKETKTNIQVNTDGSPKNAPTNWYDYENKRWANIMTNKDGLITYWTYIPRYEYRVLPGINTVEINFIEVGKDAHEGYQIPDSFTFDGKPLKGYWISKYEVQEQK